MFRFATEFASAKFRFLSGRKVAPSPPQVRHPRSSSKPQSVQGTENDHPVSPCTSPEGPRGATVWTGKTVARKRGPLDMDGRGDSVVSGGMEEAFGTKLMKRLHRGHKSRPILPQEVNKGQQTTFASQESPSMVKEIEETDSTRPRDTDVTSTELTDKQSECKTKKFLVRGRIRRILRIFRRQKVAPLNVIPKMGHPTPAPEVNCLPNLKSQNSGQAQDVATSLDKDKHNDGDASSDPSQDCHTNNWKFKTSSRLSLTDEVNAKTHVPLSLNVTLKAERIDGREADILENGCQGGLESSARLCSCEKLQNEEQGCSPGDVGSVASRQLLGGSARETSLDQTSMIRCTSSTSRCHEKQGDNRMGAIVASSVNGKFSQTFVKDESARSAEGVRKSTASIRGKLSIGVELTEKNLLDVKPNVLADEIRTLSPGAKQCRIQEITAHIKRRVDLQTLRDLTNNTLPYTSNEEKEIEVNAKRAETLLSQLKTVITKADERKEKMSSVPHHSRQQLSVKAQRHSGNSNNLSGYCVQNGTSSESNYREPGVTSSPLHQPALLLIRKGSSVKNRVLQQKHTKPSKSKAAALCPAINRKTFRKTTAVSEAKAASKDPQTLGLPVIGEQDLEPVQTKKGTAIKLGSGDYGDVFLLRSCADGTLVAVKRLTDLGGGNQKDKRTDEMLQEIRAMEAVRSCRVFPRFLGVLDMYSFAQEFVGNARTMISSSAFKLLYRNLRGPHLLPLDWVRICIDVTEGLEMLHGAGWTHNDLHVGNILVWRDPKRLTATWEAKIIDLGKASPINSPPLPKILTYMQMMFAFKNCTQMAPEIVEGRSRYNVKSDVYSLGVVLQDIGKENRLLSSFKTIGNRCVVEEPDQRPELKIILKELNQLCYKLISPRRRGKVKATR